jgi:hypothetical protein
MPLNKTKISITDMTPTQFREWCFLIVNEVLFNDRDKLVTLIAQNTDRETLTEGFRAFFEAYSYDLAFDLDEQEGAVLKALEVRKELAHLRQRVADVEGERKISQKGREARRVGMSVIGDPLPQIKVRALLDTEFREFLDTLVNWQLFAARARVAKLLKEPPSIMEHVRLQTAFYEFFVCHLELEQFLGNYDYDPDEGLEIRPEVAAELDRSIAEVKAGGKTYSLEEVFRELDGE